MTNHPNDEDEEIRKKLKELEKYIPILESLIQKSINKPQEKKDKLQYFYNLLISSSKGLDSPKWKKTTLDRLEIVLKTLASDNVEPTISSTLRNPIVQIVNVSNECQPSTSRQTNLSTTIQTIIDLDDDVVEVGESSVHRNALETTVSDNEIEIIEVERDQLSSSHVFSRRPRSQYDDDDCWEIPQYEPLLVEEEETWVRCGDDGDIIDEIPIPSRPNVQKRTNDENVSNKSDRSDRYERGRSRERADRFHDRRRSSSRERSSKWDKYDRPDNHKRSNKHKKKHKRSNKDNRPSKQDRLDRYDWPGRPDRSDRPDRHDRVSDRPKHLNLSSSRADRSTVIIDDFEGSRRNRESESTTVINPGSRLVPVNSEDFQKMVAEAIEKLAKKKKNEEAEKSKILEQDLPEIAEEIKKMTTKIPESSKDKPYRQKPDHPNETGVNVRPNMVCEISTTSQDAEVSSRVPAPPDVDHASTIRDFGNPIELPNQIGFNSRPSNNVPSPYPVVMSTMNSWIRNPGPEVVMPQLMGPFQLPSQPVPQPVSQPVPQPFPMMQPFPIGPVPPPRLIQPTAPFPRLPSHPPANLPRPHWNPNVVKSRTEVQGPRPGISSSNVRPGGASFTRAPLTYGEYKARQSTFARDPRNSRSHDRSARTSVQPSTSNISMKDSRSALDRDPRNHAVKARTEGTSETSSVPKSSKQISIAKPQKDDKSKDLKVQNSKIKSSKGPLSTKPAESHKPKSSSKDYSDEKKGSKSSSQDVKKRVDDSKNVTMKKPSVEVYQSPLESLYGVVNTSRTGPGYGLQKFKIPKIRRKVPTPPTPSPRSPPSSPTQEEEDKIEENVSIPIPDDDNENWFENDPLPDTFTLGNENDNLTQRKQSLEDHDDAIDLTEVEWTTSAKKDENEALEMNDLITTGSSDFTKKDDSQSSKVNDLTTTRSSNGAKKEESQSLDLREILEKLKNNDITLEDAEKLMERLNIKAKSRKTIKSSDTSESSDSEQERSKKSSKKEKKKKKKRYVIESDSSEDDFPKRQDENINRETEKPTTYDDTINFSRVPDIPNIGEVDQNQFNEKESDDKSKEAKRDAHQAETVNDKKIEKKKRRKNDLEKLHDDIKEMYIGGEVLSLLDQPTCRTKYESSKGLVESSDDTDVPLENTQKHKSKIKADNRSKYSSKLRVTLERIDASNVNANANISSDESSDNDDRTSNSSLNQRKNVNDGTSNDNAKKKKKKRSSWQNGVLPRLFKKRPARTTVNNEPEVQSSKEIKIGKTQTVTSKQLLDYIWVDQQRTKCLCCNYIGKNIVHHYSVLHPNEEVMISRLSMDQAEKAINQALQSKRNSETMIDVIMSYKCRFCTYSKTSAVPAMALPEFYEHCSTHTGEYRYRCSFCPYRALAEGTVRTHFYKICKHKTKSNVNDAVIDEKIPSQGNSLFGHICSKCNFVQLKRSTVEAHAKRWHKDSDVEVIEINMSDYIKVEENKDLESDEEIDNVNNIIDMLIKEETQDIEEYTDKEEPTPLVEDIITEKEIVCPNIKAEDTLVNEQTETAEETDPLDGIGNAVKEECCEDINETSEQLDASINSNTAEEYYDQVVTTENFLASEQPDESVVHDTSGDLCSIKIENIASLQNVQLDEMEELENTKCVEVSMSPQLKRPATSSISVPVPPKCIKSISPVSNEPAKLNLAISTPSTTSMPVFQRQSTANHSISHYMHPDVNFDLESSCLMPAISTSSPAVESPVLQTVNVKSECLTTFANSSNFFSTTDISQEVPSVQNEIANPLTYGVSMPETMPLETSHDMIAPEKLHNLFKCMANQCDFTTNAPELFHMHYTQHYIQAKKPRTHHDFQRCAYCLELLPDILLMIEHIQNEHAHCNYLCKYCYYRGACSSYVEAHQQVKHPEKEVEIIAVEVPVSMPPPGSIDRSSRVIPYRCIDACKKIFLIPRAFKAHLDMYHNNSNGLSCSFCHEISPTSSHLIEHYEVTHNISQYQCLHCNFGTSQVEKILIHLSEFHCNKHPIILDRSFPRKPITTMRAIDQLIVKNLENISDKPLTMNVSKNNYANRNDQEPTRATEEFVSTNLYDFSHVLEAANPSLCKEMACTSFKDSGKFVEPDLNQRPRKRKSDEDPISKGLRHKLFRTSDFQSGSNEDKMNSCPD